MVAAAAAALRRGLRAPSGSTSQPGPEPRGPGATGPPRRAAAGDACWATPPTTRPRRCCSTCCAAPGSTGWRPWRPTIAGRSSRCVAPRPRQLCADARSRRVDDPIERRPGLPAQPRAPRGAAAARRRRRARRRPGAGPPGRAAAATRPTCSTSGRGDLDPTDAARARGPPRSPSARRRCGAGCATCSTERHPPDAATVERVLAVARRAVSGPPTCGGGWRVERTAAAGCAWFHRRSPAASGPRVMPAAWTRPRCRGSIDDPSADPDRPR